MNKLLLATTALLFSLGAAAHGFQAGKLQIGHPWSREMPEQSPTAAAYLTITNTGPEADRLVSASTTQADKAELHTMTVDNGIMKMRALDDGIVIKPGETVKLAPGGMHVMLFGLRKAPRAGALFPLTLRFEKAGQAVVQVMVQKGDAGGEHAGH